ncbi:zinc-binding protein A33-like [Narcine bancroftii]|uniref:zinc-binding protein A33-like n=1 Tax=Narcine bancroftii TaxID=1343680 RepID=UPI0038314B50
MALGRSTGSLLDELSCPLCRQPYTEPVVLDCGHVFCRECISRWWEAGRARRCPECGGTVPGGSLQPSRALDRLVQQIVSVSLGPRHCGDHRGEELELFCDTDKKFLCVMCLDRRDGRSHRAHNFMLIGEAVEIHRCPSYMAVKKGLTLSTQPESNRVPDLPQRSSGNPVKLTWVTSTGKLKLKMANPLIPVTSALACVCHQASEHPAVYPCGIRLLVLILIAGAVKASHYPLRQPWHPIILRLSDVTTEFLLFPLFQEMHSSQPISSCKDHRGFEQAELRTHNLSSKWGFQQACQLATLQPRKATKPVTPWFIPITYPAVILPLSFQGKLKVTLNSLKQWKSDYLEFEAKQQERIAKIKDQSSQLQDHIASEFSKLRSALDGEQEKLFNYLRVQEKGVLARMEMNLGDIQNALLQTEEMLAEAQKQLESHDIYMLVKDTPLDDKSAEDNYQPMIKEGKMTLGMFQGPIQYRVWKQVKDVIRPVPAYLTLNPNTAHPRLLLSDDLTLVSYSNVKQDVPDNPERFDTCVCVLGAEAFTFGKHYWEVQVGTKTEWDVGVVKESISRKGHTTATPDAGYWIVWLRNGNEYKATTVPRTRLSVTVKPKAIGVYLDYESGQVSFYNVDDMTHLYTFTDIFLERLFPYFSPGINDDGQNSDPMKIFPVQYHDE